MRQIVRRKRLEKTLEQEKEAHKNEVATLNVILRESFHKTVQAMYKVLDQVVRQAMGFCPDIINLI